MKIGCYLRVSSKGQADNNGVDSQRALIGQWLTKLGATWEDALVFEDLAFTGTNMTRPSWIAMNAAIDRGEIGTVVAYSMTRIARNVPEGAKWMRSMLDRGLRVVVGALDLNGSSGPEMRLASNMLLAFAEFENDNRKASCRAGIKARLAQGKKWGFALTRGNVFTPEEAQALRDRTRKGETIYAVWRSLPPGRASYNTVKAACKSQ